MELVIKKPGLWCLFMEDKSDVEIFPIAYSVVSRDKDSQLVDHFHFTADGDVRMSFGVFLHMAEFPLQRDVEKELTSENGHLRRVLLEDLERKGQGEAAVAFEDQ